MFNNKLVKVLILAVSLVALLAPFAMQLSALSQDAAEARAPYTWKCADLPGFCAPINSGCSGDVMSYSGCRFWCKTGTTVSSTIRCDWLVSKEEVR